MSFGSNSTTKQATNNLSGVSNAAMNNLFPQVTAAGTKAIGTGEGLVNTGIEGVKSGETTAAPGINFFKTLMGGNQANTTAMLQPNIDAIRGTNANALTAINTLMPRGGGRSGALFNQSFEPQRQMQNLFNTARTTAATTLPQIGLQQQQLGLGQQQVGLGQQGVGTNLFNIGQGTLGTAGNVNTNLADIGQRQQQISNNLWSGIGSSLFGLATVPFGGASKNILQRL